MTVPLESNEQLSGIVPILQLKIRYPKEGKNDWLYIRSRGNPRILFQFLSTYAFMGRVFPGT